MSGIYDTLVFRYLTLPSTWIHPVYSGLPEIVALGLLRVRPPLPDKHPFGLAKIGDLV